MGRSMGGLALRPRTRPRSSDCERGRRDRARETGAFRVQGEAAPWDRRDSGTPRRAGVSAFGFGGINAHLLIEEWDPSRCGTVGGTRPSRLVKLVKDAKTLLPRPVGPGDALSWDDVAKALDFLPENIIVIEHK